VEAAAAITSARSPQCAEVDQKERRIVGSKSVLQGALVAASSAKTAGLAVPSFVPKRRTRHDSNV
jgi:hypothetical protein